MEQGSLQAFLRFTGFSRLYWASVATLHESGAADQGPGSPPPGVALQILGSVEADSVNPGPQIAHRADPLPVAPALEKSILGSVLSVLIVSQNKKQRAYQLGAEVVVGAKQIFSWLAQTLGGRQVFEKHLLGPRRELWAAVFQRGYP